MSIRLRTVDEHELLDEAEKARAAVDGSGRRRVEVGGCERCGGAIENLMEVSGPETVCLICGHRPRPAASLPRVRLTRV